MGFEASGFYLIVVHKLVVKFKRVKRLITSISELM
jgi:hypothetical protein